MSIAESISGAGDTIVMFFETCKEGIVKGAVWCGHTISYGFNNYLVPAIQATWAMIAGGSIAALVALNTGFGGMGILLAIGIGALIASQIPQLQDQSTENIIGRCCLIALGALAIGGAAALGCTFGASPLIVLA
jgi:hypothetical protein